MLLFKQSTDLTGYLDQKRKEGQSIGFVPTMGALHQGHLSLIEASKKEVGLTVCSIFVNPTQFNDPNDYKKYPITIGEDIYLLEKAGADVLFLPSVLDIYPNGTDHLEKFDLGFLETILEGKYRPGHFQGVCQVMDRLLTLVHPDHLYMGQKDFQQCMVVKKLLQIKKIPLRFHECPTLREPDGLAMSSRNMRLNGEERKNATAIFQALSYIKNNFEHLGLTEMIAHAKEILLEKDFRIDYLEVADSKTLEPLNTLDNIKKHQTLVALVAAYQHEVRLIDNMVLRGKVD
jgi:pantoate--beta-alanine ligase